MGNNKSKGIDLNFFEILTLIFVIFKLLGRLNWSWTACFVPILVQIGIIIFCALASGDEKPY